MEKFPRQRKWNPLRKFHKSNFNYLLNIDIAPGTARKIISKLSSLPAFLDVKMTENKGSVSG